MKSNRTQRTRNDTSPQVQKVSIPGPDGPSLEAEGYPSIIHLDAARMTIDGKIGGAPYTIYWRLQFGQPTTVIVSFDEPVSRGALDDAMKAVIESLERELDRWRCRYVLTQNPADKRTLHFSAPA